MITDGIAQSIDKLKDALFAAPGAQAARVVIKQSNFALFRAANYPLARLFLLKHRPSSGRLTDVFEIEEHWHVEFLETAGALKISIATLDALFGDTITQSSFVAFGAPDADGDLEVFEIDPDGRDIAAPSGASPCWTIICSKIKSERYNAGE